MSQPNGQSHLSLLSLSIAAASAAPISATLPVAGSRPSQGALMNTTKHRRLSSAGRSRRLSDARDAATRPFPTSLQTASASLAALSLSSPTVSHRSVLGGAQPIQVPRTRSSAKGASESELGSVDDTSSPSHTPLASNTSNVAKPARKRGSIFTCESCSKVYRHPSCLIKHRWEHTPQWREASKFVLSKHQQVQLLEAAAILSHLSPSSASLPEDRSLWPSFLSGGLVPLPTPVPSNHEGGPTPTATTATTATWPHAPASGVYTPFPVSSSVPAGTVLSSHRAGSTGPRLHDYALGAGGTDVTQVRPGILGVPTTAMNGKSSPMPMPMPISAQTTEDDALNLLALGSERSASISASVPSSSPSLSHSASHAHSHSHSLSHLRLHSHSHSLSLSDAPSKERERRRSNAYEYGLASGAGPGLGYDPKSGPLVYACVPRSIGGWSLPRSSVRSKSGSSRSPSGSASESRSDDEDEGVFGDMDVEHDLEDGPEGARRARVYESRTHLWKTENGDEDVGHVTLHEDQREDAEDDKAAKRGSERTWDGMDMDMDMD